MVTREKVVEAAKQCYDPEIPVNVWDLGLIYEIAVEENDAVRIKMSLTSKACPAAQALPDLLKSLVRKHTGAEDVQVEVVFEPMWTPERISEEGKKKLGIEDA